MGKKDVVSRDYMSDNNHFADAFNYSVGGGKLIVKPEELTDVDVVEDAAIDTDKYLFTSKKIRDNAKKKGQTD